MFDALADWILLFKKTQKVHFKCLTQDLAHHKWSVSAVRGRKWRGFTLRERTFSQIEPCLNVNLAPLK